MNEATLHWPSLPNGAADQPSPAPKTIEPDGTDALNDMLEPVVLVELPRRDTEETEVTLPKAAYTSVLSL